MAERDLRIITVVNDDRSSFALRVLGVSFQLTSVFDFFVTFVKSPDRRHRTNLAPLELLGVQTQRIRRLVLFIIVLEVKHPWT